MDPFKHKKFFKFIFLIKNGQTTLVLFLMLGNFPKDFFLCRCSLWRLRGPNLTFGKMPLGKLHIWEVVTWEIVTEKLPFRKCLWENTN